jgi:hypothetical protein
MLFYELTSWWMYRRIKHPSMWWYVWGAPAALAAASSVAYVLLPIKPTVDAVVTGVLQILAVLPGFYIAALAAVSTFDRPEMDEAMPAPAPKVPIYREGKWIEVALTRRLFLTYLFSYLSVLSLGIAAICVAVNLVEPSAKYILESFSKPHLLSAFAEYSFVFVLSYFCASILISTLHGIYFLAERMHQPH